MPIKKAAAIPSGIIRWDRGRFLSFVPIAQVSYVSITFPEQLFNFNSSYAASSPSIPDNLIGGLRKTAVKCLYGRIYVRP